MSASSSWTARGFVTRFQVLARRWFSCMGSVGRSRTGAVSHPSSRGSIVSSFPTCRGTGTPVRYRTLRTWTTSPTRFCNGRGGGDRQRRVGRPLARRNDCAARGHASSRLGARRRPRRGCGRLVPRRGWTGDGDADGLVEPGQGDRSASPSLGELDARPTRRLRLVGSGRRGPRSSRTWPRRSSPAPRFHTKTRQAGRALLANRSACRTRADHVPRPLPLGRERQVGQARRRDRVRAPPRSALSVRSRAAVTS